jgi:hypothetical protein
MRLVEMGGKLVRQLYPIGEANEVLNLFPVSTCETESSD